jgi:hypothetical protein
MLFNRSRFLTEQQINQQQKWTPSDQQLGIWFPQNVIKWREAYCGIIKRLFFALTQRTMLFNRSRFLNEQQINQQQKRTPSEQQLGIWFPQNVIKWWDAYCGIIERLVCFTYATYDAIQQVKIFNWTANKSTTKKNSLRPTARDLVPSKCYQMKGSIQRYNKTSVFLHLRNLRCYSTGQDF